MQIDRARLTGSLQEMASIGATAGGGVSRLALTDEDKAGRDLLGRWMRDAGLDVRIDDIGNMIGVRPGRTDDPPLIIGSHADSVPFGGRFDGILGVLTGLEVIRTLNDHDIETRLPVHLVNWTNEEGVRFQPSMLGSAAALGLLDRDRVDDLRDGHGIRFGDELDRIGYRGDVANRPIDATAYLELHIEQGPVLERFGYPVGIVLGIIGETWHALTLTGQAAHAGPTPMDVRHDALMAAAELTLTARDIAVRQGPPSVATVGSLHVFPDAINVIPGKVEMTLDLRNEDGAMLRRMWDEFESEALRICHEHGVGLEIRELERIEPSPFSPEVIDAVRVSVDALGIEPYEMWSGAGHDALNANTRWPTGMIFVRSIGGVSHCEEELSTDEDIALGANVLLRTVVELAGGRHLRLIG